VNQISRELLRICAKFIRKTCLVPRLESLNVKVKGQGHQGQKTCCALPSPPAVTKWNALAANNVMQQQTGPFRCCWGGVISAACVQSVFGKTALLPFLVCLQPYKFSGVTAGKARYPRIKPSTHIHVAAAHLIPTQIHIRLCCLASVSS